VGFVLALAGLAAIALGVWEWLNPLAFDQFTRSLPRGLDSRAWGRWWHTLVGLRQ
jgi:CHASE2 domain-containing sensor protein